MEEADFKRFHAVQRHVETENDKFSSRAESKQKASVRISQKLLDDSDILPHMLRGFDEESESDVMELSGRNHGGIELGQIELKIEDTSPKM